MACGGRGRLWVSLDTGMMNVQLAEGAADADLVLQVLIDLGLKFVRCRPAHLEVTDTTLGARLAEVLADPELTVSVRADLPAVDQVFGRWSEEMSDRPRVPDALDAPGVTVERMRAFADAAREFYEAAPWQHLSDADLVHVEAPTVASGLRHFTVLGAARSRSASGSCRARGSSRRCRTGDPDPSNAPRSSRQVDVVFGPVDEMPFGDADLWEDAIFRGRAVGVPGRHVVRPGPAPPAAGDELADLTTILHALARTSEAEIDAGRWTHEVPAHDGPRNGDARDSRAAGADRGAP